MNAHLLQVLRIVIRADSDPARQALFANLRQSRLTVGLAYALHERLRGTRPAALLVAGYGLACFLGITPPRNRRARVLAAATHENARRQVARVVSWMGPADADWVQRRRRGRPRLSDLSKALGLLSPARLSRAFRIIGRVGRGHGFLVACRVASAIAWYARAAAIVAAHRPGAVLVSSDSNPEELGFAGAARACGIPQVFVSHAFPTPFSPPLNFSLSILEGDAAVRARRQRGPIAGTVLLAGLEGDSAPLDAGRFDRGNPVIGICAPKAVSWPTLAAIVDDCRRHFHARQIVIRWHPSRLDPARRIHRLGDLTGIVQTPRTALLEKMVRQCDWVIADENSNVHLPVLKLGVPTIAVRHLGLYPDSRSDLYGFAAGGIIFPPVSSIREVQPEALSAFFAEGWPARFRQYDAAYLQPQDGIGTEVRRAISRLLDEVAPNARYA